MTGIFKGKGKEKNHTHIPSFSYDLMSSKIADTINTTARIQHFINADLYKVQLTLWHTSRNEHIKELCIHKAFTELVFKSRIIVITQK